jgi:hypothetical protein
MVIHLMFGEAIALAAEKQGDASDTWKVSQNSFMGLFWLERAAE